MLPFIVDCCLFVVCCLLFVVCRVSLCDLCGCVMFVAYRVLLGGCCSVFVASWLLLVARCLLRLIDCRFCYRTLMFVCYVIVFLFGVCRRLPSVVAVRCCCLLLCVVVCCMMLFVTC